MRLQKHKRCRYQRHHGNIYQTSIKEEWSIQRYTMSAEKWNLNVVRVWKRAPKEISDSADLTASAGSLQPLGTLILRQLSFLAGKIYSSLPEDYSLPAEDWVTKRSDAQEVDARKSKVQSGILKTFLNINGNVAKRYTPGVRISSHLVFNKSLFAEFCTLWSW